MTTFQAQVRKELVGLAELGVKRAVKALNKFQELSSELDEKCMGVSEGADLCMDLSF